MLSVEIKLLSTGAPGDELVLTMYGRFARFSSVSTFAALFDVPSRLV
ncbi:protein of unknown function [Methylocaldum szegediense]|jgi:hypothetical protein|uniref:Uncharacterized protein n=1 Tax=Methylocaldum szegediense TaxID=73780 RepID=A0ABM9HVU5_9GAMM|nr:protein of unknown function [Methylocaldum szegediense]